MSAPAIEVSGLGKRYVIQHESRHDNLRDTLHHTARKLWRRLRWGTGFETEEFWALRDIDFRVEPGEVVGVIGRNGAGKSTLLKILSRITEPTQGRITLNGRVASLLEVGTGFHPELSGRENIFLNGAILGMSRTEISRKFDEIVAFAEVERFLDTPVKRYSSGMYVRLAFAVAAHLEPEILIVDEVLAVGDAQFQAKCLGKINEVANQDGRTVLLVSHNMESVLRLCRSALLLANGRVAYRGSVAEAVSHYSAVRVAQGGVVDCHSLPRPGWISGGARFVRLEQPDTTAANAWQIGFGDAFTLAADVASERNLADWCIYLAVFSMSGVEVAANQSPALPPLKTGSRHRIICDLREFRLTPGSYTISIGLRSGSEVVDFLSEVLTLQVQVNETSAALQTGNYRGFYVPSVDYSVLDL